MTAADGVATPLPTYQDLLASPHDEDLFEHDEVLGATFDSSPVIDADGSLLGITRMVHITDYACFHEQGYYTPGDRGAPVYETSKGRIGVAICYDWLFPEPTRMLALNGAEVLVRVSAYMDPWGTAAPLDWWTTVNRVRALENMAYVVAANQALFALFLHRRGLAFALAAPHCRRSMDNCHDS